MRKVIIAGVSAVALGFAGTALAADTSSTTDTGQGMSAQHEGQHADKQELMKAQQKLKAEGLYKGKVDGENGPETMAALKQFQKKSGLQQTGELDEQTEAKLGLSEESGSSTMPQSPHATPNQPQGKSSITGGGAGTSGQGANGTQTK